MSKKCICPEDGRLIPSYRRVVVIEPTAVMQVGPDIVTDRSKIHIFDKDCPVHGYTEITE